MPTSTWPLGRNFAAAIVAAALLPVAAPIAASAAPSSEQVSFSGYVTTNWSGYVATSGPFTSVSATWVQPTLACSHSNSYASFWVGLDGYGSNTVEQTGSAGDCVDGAAVYYGWSEAYPGPESRYPRTVHSGDSLTATVTSHNSTFVLTLRDATRGWTEVSKQDLAAATRASAEIIVESPAAAGVVQPLADFGQVEFHSSEMDLQPLVGTASTPVEMERNGIVDAKPSGVNPVGTFGVTWLHP